MARNNNNILLEGKYVSVINKENGEFEIKLWNGKVLKPFEDLALDESDIEKENVNQPSLYAIYANAYALAVYQKYLTENAIDVLEGRLDAVIRQELIQAGEKVKENEVRRKIYTNFEYIELREQLAKEETIVVLLKEVLNAFVHKREALFHFSTTGRIVMRSHLERLRGGENVEM